MTLKEPFKISARLLPALQVADGWVSLERTNKPGKPTYRWFIDIPAGEYSRADLASWGTLQAVFSGLLTFLADAPDLFSREVEDWARKNHDEITILQCEVEESEGLIT